MKKNLFGWLAMATMLVGTGCSSDEVVNDYSPENAIQFGTYVGRDAQGRASVITETGNGDKGELSLQEKGFGVFAYYTDEAEYNDNSPCNFMYNQLVSGANWGYTPLKYWPNDVNDRLTFFAYAPHTTSDVAYSNITIPELSRIEGDPIITFAVNNEVKKQTDLLYSKSNTMNLTKNKVAPNGISVDEKVTFTFAHALSRIGFTVKAVVDEVDPGTNKLDASTTIVLKKVILSKNAHTDHVDDGFVYPSTGAFYTNGSLNINGGSWSSQGGTQIFTLDNDDFIAQSTNPTYYDGQGFVLTENTTVLTSGNSTTANPLNTPNSYIMIIPQDFTEDGKEFHVFVEYDVITHDSDLYSQDDAYNNLKSKITNHISTPVEINFVAGKAYSLNLQLGMTSVKLDAEVVTWEEPEIDHEVDLPANQ